MTDPITIFDRRAVRRHRDRAAPGLGAHDFLFTEVAERLSERLDDVTRRFPVALDLGCHTGEMGRQLAGRGGIERLIQSDLSSKMAARAGPLALAADEEALPFADASLDLVLSSLSLHWVNDLPGALLQIRRALKPDGLFLAAMIGGESLIELRDCLLAAELELEGGAAPRVSPFADLPDAGALLQRAGFALPVVDSDRITVTYPHALSLMADLRGMGESNALVERRRNGTRRSTLYATAATYAERYADADDRIPASFEILYLTAWAPHESQPRPAPRGSGQIDLAASLKGGKDAERG
jgi:NADH dehydrogenase [ubiquinone] 1 alpha subcomplex assembly factor 5